MKLRSWWAPTLICASVGLLFLKCAASPYYGGDGIPNGGGGTGGSGGIGVTGGTGGGSCNCPSGFTCEQGVCVAPEQEVNRGLTEAPPVATPHYVYALNPTAASVARIDPLSLAIEAIPVGPKPVALAALPGEDAAIALSYDDASLSIIDSTTLPSKVTRIALKRQHARLTLSSDGAFAVAWPDPATAPSSGAEGLFTLINLERLRSGAPVSECLLERAGGYRLTNVVFRSELGVTSHLYVFAKSSVSAFDLRSGGAMLPQRFALPASMSTDVRSREVVASDDGQVVMLRATVAPELAFFDGTELTRVPLSEVATDLDLLPDGTGAVAALRSIGSLAYLRIPQDIQAPSGIRVIPVADGGVGQVALPPVTPASGMFALAYSNVSGDESFSKVDLTSGLVTPVPLEKWVDEVAISPDARSAIVLHRANPATVASDPYEAAVDRDQGFSVYDVESGVWQLQRTGTTRPTRYAFSPRGGYIGVALRDDGLKRFALQAVNLNTLVSSTLPLASTPLFMGLVPEAPSITPHRVFVSQEHSAGRISVIQLDSGQVRTVTGFTLNGEIE